MSECNKICGERSTGIKIKKKKIWNYMPQIMDKYKSQFCWRHLNNKMKIVNKCCMVIWTFARELLIAQDIPPCVLAIKNGYDRQGVVKKYSNVMANYSCKCHTINTRTKLEDKIEYEECRPCCCKCAVDVSKGGSNILDVVNVEFFFLGSWRKNTSICNMISLMFLNLSVIFIFFPCLLDNSSSPLPFSFFKCSYLLILVCHSHHFYGSQRESNLLANLINDSPTTFCRYKKCTFPSFLKSYNDNSVVHSVFNILSLTSWGNISEWKLLIVFNSSSSILAILPGFLGNTFGN